MRKRSRFSSILETIGSAIQVAAAVENNRKADPHHLRALGIDPAQFDKIGQ